MQFQMDTTRAVHRGLGSTTANFDKGISEVQKAPDTPRNHVEASVVQQSASPELWRRRIFDRGKARGDRCILSNNLAELQVHKCEARHQKKTQENILNKISSFAQGVALLSYAHGRTLLLHG